MGSDPNFGLTFPLYHFKMVLIIFVLVYTILKSVVEGDAYERISISGGTDQWCSERLCMGASHADTFMWNGSLDDLFDQVLPGKSFWSLGEEHHRKYFYQFSYNSAYSQGRYADFPVPEPVHGAGSNYRNR